MSKALSPIEVIADDVAADLGDSVGRYKFSLMRKIYAGARDMSMYIGQDHCVKTAVLQVDNVICMPDDFIYELKVGVRKNGRIAILTLNDGVQKSLLSQEQTQQQLCDFWGGVNFGEEYVFYNYLWNNSLGELYGWSGVWNCNGYYNIDRAKGEIYIGSLMPEDAEIVIEYQSSGQEDGLTLVPTEWWNALKYYALSEWYATKNMGLHQLHRANYEREYNKVHRLYTYRTSLFLANTIAESWRSSVH